MQNVPPLKCSSMNHLWNLIVGGKILVKEMIAETAVKKKSGNKTYFLTDQDSYIVATSEIDGARELPRDTTIFGNELQ